MKKVYRSAEMVGKSGTGQKRVGETTRNCYTGKVIWLGSIGIRYIEAGVLVALLVSTALLYMRFRPRGLVWWSAIAMAATAAHLYLEEGRWQMGPAYLLLFVLLIWLAAPSRRRFRVPGMVVRIAITVLLVVPSLALPFLVPLFRTARLQGTYNVGMAAIAVSGSRVRCYYPAEESDSPAAPYWTPRDIAQARLPGVPSFLTWHLSLVPLPASLRAPLCADEMPLLLIVPSPSSQPSDYVRTELQAAGNGWLVVEMEPDAGVEEVVGVIALLQSGEADQAFDGHVAAHRVALILTGAWPESSHTDDDLAGLGLPWLHYGGELGSEVTIAGRQFAVTFGDASIPTAAYTTRSRMVVPPQLLIGSSDVAPADCSELLARITESVLADGSATAPVFSGAAIDQREVIDGIEGARFQQLAASPQ